ncbi:hypothetical protein [Laceyella putida]|uniref:EthD domain-containing protein n=1 Tax=Laceyella putida TaxID=110101 RepID=A0ABW2RL51_9BACL
MKMKFTFLFRNHEETKDTDQYSHFLQNNIIPNVLKVEGVSHVELCHLAPFTFVAPPNGNQEEPQHLLQMDIYYNSVVDFQQAMNSFNDAYLVEEIVKAADYTDLYISYIVNYSKENV